MQLKKIMLKRKRDNIYGGDSFGIMNLPKVEQKIKHKTSWKIEKFADQKAFEDGDAYEVSNIEGNILVNAGINLLTSLLAGGGGTAFSNANAYLGVGDDDTAAAAGQTDLIADTNKLRKGMNDTYPTYGSGQEIVFQSDFLGNEANFAWKEFAAFNASSSGTMLNRKVQDEGTKSSGQVWRLTLTIEFE